MTGEEYIEARRSAGHKLHFHDGIWWESVRKGYCKPAIPFEEIDPTCHKPSLWRSAIGYTHRVPEGSVQSSTWHALVMPQSRIVTFSIDSLNARRRRAVRKGLRCNDVTMVADLPRFKKEMTAIALSTAVRNKRGYPPAYYKNNADQWWRGIMKGSAYTDFWAAFHDKRMVAYLAVQVAGHRAVVDGVKSLTEYLTVNPNDALMFALLQSCRDQGMVKEIFHGHWSIDKPTLNDYKESFGFTKVEVPYLRKFLFGLVKYPIRQT